MVHEIAYFRRCSWWSKIGQKQAGGGRVLCIMPSDVIYLRSVWRSLIFSVDVPAKNMASESVQPTSGEEQLLFLCQRSSLSELIYTTRTYVRVMIYENRILLTETCLGAIHGVCSAFKFCAYQGLEHTSVREPMSVQISWWNPT